MARLKKDVQHELSQLSNDIRALQGNKEKETEYRAAMDKMVELTTELNDINVNEAAERALASAAIDKDVAQAARRFSFVRFFRDMRDKDGSGLTGVEAEMAALAITEARNANVMLEGVGIPSAVLNIRAFEGMTAGTPSDGGLTIATELQYQEVLRKRLVLGQAGAQMLSGLIGNISLIEGSEITASWEGENTAVGNSKKTFTARKFSPKRLALKVPISKLLLVQSSWDIERMILNDIIAVHASKLEQAAINGNGTGQPLGILNIEGVGAVVIGTNGGALTYGKVVDLETAVAVNDADFGQIGYITTPGVRGFGKQTLKSANVSGYIWEGKELNGYNAFVSNLMPSDIMKGTGTNLHAMIFGNFNDVVIGQWGGLDVTVDPYTKKDEGAIEIAMCAFHDVFVRRPQSFAAIKDIALS